jgi:hypothetical protein
LCSFIGSGQFGAVNPNLGLGAIADALRNQSFRRRSEWNDRFSHWERAESTTETDIIMRARNMVQSVLNHDPLLQREKVQVAQQGSFTNRTNVRNEADIDLRVQHPSLKLLFDPNVEQTSAIWSGGYYDYGRTYADISTSLRTTILTTLRRKFGRSNVDDSGKKAIRVHGVEGSRAEVDVVPCFTLHHVRGGGLMPPYTVEGVAVLSTDNIWAYNYPDHHIENGRKKRTNTGHQFKKVVRTIKRLQSDMIDHGIAIERIPSFLIECLVYIVEDH